MSKLNVRTRQTYLKELGFYKGEVDGKEGPLTKKAYKDLQNKYFTKRDKDRDGKYGPDTDKLLRSAYNCRDIKHFDLDEFACKCVKDCTGYPAVLSRNLVLNLDKAREHYKKSFNIASGIRCKKHNKRVGGDTGSKHMKGRSADVRITTISNTFKGRKGAVDYWTKELGQYHSYCDDYRVRGGKTSYPNKPGMGNSVHFETKE